MRQITHDFESAGISIQLAQDLTKAGCQKLVWNIPYNRLSVILDASTDKLMADEYTSSLV